VDADTLLAIVLCVSAACYELLAGRLFVRRLEVANVPIAIAFVIIGLWVFGGALEILATDYVMFSVGRIGHFLGTALIPVLLLVTFRDFIGQTNSRNMVLALLIIPVSSIIVAATNYWHEFMWYLPAVNEAGEYLTRPRQWGPWFLFLHAPHGYAVIGFSILTLMMHSSAVAPVHRRGLFLLAGAALVPVLAIVAYDFGLGSTTISIVPLVFAAMLPVYAWLIIGEQIIEFSPLAYETVFQNMQDPVVVLDDQGRIIGLNRGAEVLLNIRERDALRATLESVFGASVPEVHDALESGMPQRMLTNTGRFLHIQVSSIKGAKPSARTGRVLMFRDVSDVEKAQREVRHSEKLLRSLIDHSVNGILRMRWLTEDTGDRSLRCIFANAAASRYLGIDSKRLLDATGEEIFDMASAGMNDTEAEMVRRELRHGTEIGILVDTEVRVGSHSNGKWLRMICEPVGEDVAITFVDVTDKKDKEIQMESIAWSDPLTGVLNRRGFERDAARRLTESADDASGALLYIDLNEFKQINDKYGHEIGDELLVIAAERLRASLRSCDIIGRPGGDEFVALVPDVVAEVAEQLAGRLTQALEQPYLISRKTLYCSASIGLALYPTHASTLTGLLRAADQAMYRAKARCRGPVAVGSRNLLEKAI